GCRGRGSTARSPRARISAPSRRGERRYATKPGGAGKADSAPTTKARGWRKGRPLPHAERLRAGGGSHVDRGRRELPGGRRVRDYPGGAASVHGRARANRARVTFMGRGGRVWF